MESVHPLREYRDAQIPPITQRQLADKIGVKRVTVARWEGGRKIDDDYVPKVAEATGIPPTILRPDLAKMMGVAAE